FRLMGKREIGELSVLDLVVFIMIGEMAVIAIESHDDPIIHSVVPIVLLLLIQVALAFFSLKSRNFRRLVDGKPTLIIKNGKIDEKMMKKHRYNFDDLLMQLRLKDVNDIDEVEFAILETSGQLSVIRKDSRKRGGSYTIPLILDGVIQQDHLQEIGKTESWLLDELKSRGHGHTKDISFCSYQNGKLFVDYQYQTDS
ncbi:MAG TPA: DUF421 domain-containing protein, partial [Bacillaceae bacterium]